MTLLERGFPITALILLWRGSGGANKAMILLRGPAVVSFSSRTRVASFAMNISGSASEGRGNNLKGFQDIYLKTKAMPDLCATFA